MAKGQYDNISGNVYSRLTAIEYSHSDHRSAFFKCICSCGKEKIARSSSLKNGDCKSCGCLRKELDNYQKTHPIRKTHSMTKSREYNSWRSMKERCLSKKNIVFDYYGGNGVTICNEWINSFESFFLDMGSCPKGYSLDRIDGKKGYSKENCKWSSSKEQNSNKINNMFYTHDGITKTQTQWSLDLGGKHDLVRFRILSGWSLKDALTLRKGEKREKTLRA